MLRKTVQRVRRSHSKKEVATTEPHRTRRNRNDGIGEVKMNRMYKSTGHRGELKPQRRWSGKALQCKHCSNSKTLLMKLRLKWLHEETLRAVMRTAVKDGSPGDEKVRFVLQDSSGETSY